MGAKKKPKAIVKPSTEPEPSPEQGSSHRNNQTQDNPAQDDVQVISNDTIHSSIEQQPTKTTNAQKNLDLSQKVARLLSQEPTSTATSNPISFQPTTNHTFASIPTNSFNPSDLSSQISSIIDQKVKILDEKLKLYQSEISKLRNDLETKNQILDEFQKFHQSEAEKKIEKHRSIAEAKFLASATLIKAQASELKENRTKIKELNEKISRIYSGEEERNRIRLESENQELVKLNEQLKSNLDSQRRRRKEAERELGRANLVAQEALQDRLKEANDEVETLKKMLEVETTNSKGLINQLNQLRSNSSNSNVSSNPHRSNLGNNLSNNSSNNLNEKLVEDLKTRASIIGDFTGFEILNSSVDNKGPIYDCMVTDLVTRGFALNFKIQFHSDNTCSYFPSLNAERDSATIKILPEFLRSFVRFQKEASAHVFWKLFQAFNL